MRIGYAPYNNSFAAPGDCRRFIAYANSRNLDIEIADINNRYDLVILSELADITYWSEYKEGKIVFDFIDSYLSVPDDSFKNRFRGLVGFARGRYRKLYFNHKLMLQKMCMRSDAVVCTTTEQLNSIFSYNKNVHIILDIQDNLIRNYKNDYKSKNPFQLVWEGLPSNLFHIKKFAKILNQINQDFPVILNVVTDKFRSSIMPYFKINVEKELKRISPFIKFFEFNDDNWNKVVGNSDLAIIPLDRSDELAFGKPENKMLIFWRMGLPVVTTKTPAYMRAQKEAHPEIILCCSNEYEWVDKIKLMISNESLRKDIGNKNKIYAETYFSKDIILKKWDKLFESIGIQM